MRVDLANALDGALWATQQGWKVHPCKGKVPTTKWAEAASSDPHQAAAWLAGTDLNYGIACGPSGLLVLDDDTGEEVARLAERLGHEVPDTFTVITGRGLHYYFQAPPTPLGNGRGRLPDKIDVRGVGGYVIGPGSTHANGATYGAFNTDLPVLPLPRWIMDYLTGPAEYSAPTPDYTGSIPIGQRHQALVSYAGHLRHLDLSDTERQALMTRRWLDCEQDPREELGLDDALAILDDVLQRYGTTQTPDERFDDDVAREVARLRVIEAARAIVRADNIPPAPPMDIALIDDIEDREVAYRIDNLVPMHGNALIVAKRKSGKSTLLLNLIRALRTGEPFLGTLEVEPITGRVAFLNYELPREMFAAWARDIGLTSSDLVSVNVRGRRNPLAYEEDREELRRRLTDLGVDIVVVDPVSRAFTGDSINDTGDMTRFLADLDILKADIGASSLVVAAHAGWNGDRARNSSVIEDWPDAIITMTADSQQRRFLSAIGRDVELDEDALRFDPRTRHLTLSGTGGRQAVSAAEHISALADDVVSIVRKEPGLNTSEIEEALRALGTGFQKGDVTKAANVALATQRITRTKEGKSTRHYPNDVPRRTPTYPDGAQDVPHTPLKGGGGRQGYIQADVPRNLQVVQELLGGEVIA